MVLLGRGRYRLKVSPRPFNVMESIEVIRRRHGDELTYWWRVEGHFWVLAEGVVFGMPREVERNPVLSVILALLLTRLACIFEALYSTAMMARMTMLKREDAARIPVPEEAVRGFILNSLPHVLGDVSGIDGDGLPTEDLVEVYETLLKALPEDVNG